MSAEPEADYRCPDCGRETCTGEDCYWPDEAGIPRPEPEAPEDVTFADPHGGTGLDDWDS